MRCGKTLFTVCASCHGAEGQGNQAFGAPALAGQNDWYLATQLRNFGARYRGRDPLDIFGAQMIGVSSMLSNEVAVSTE